MKNRINYLLILFIIGLFSCGGIDEEYKEFLEESDILYPGKVDSVQVFTGNERIKFNVLLSSDPNVKSIRIYWRGRLDSIQLDIAPEEIGKRKEVMIPKIAEGEHTFYIHTYNKNNLSSVPTEVFSKVYGPKFHSHITRRMVNSASMKNPGKVDVYWDTPNSYYGDTRVEIVYPQTDGTENKVEVSADQQLVVLNNYKMGSPFKYKTFILPDTSCMDEFVTDYTVQPVNGYYDTDKSTWSVVSVSKQDSKHLAKCCIDGKEYDDKGKSGLWIARAGYPYNLVLDLGKETSVSAFYFVQRTQEFSAQIKDVKIYTNNTGDDSEPWTLVTEGMLNKKPGRQNILCPNTQKIRFVKFEFLENWNKSKDLSLIELGAFLTWE